MVGGGGGRTAAHQARCRVAGSPSGVAVPRAHLAVPLLLSTHPRAAIMESPIKPFWISSADSIIFFRLRKRMLLYGGASGHGFIISRQPTPNPALIKWCEARAGCCLAGRGTLQLQLPPATERWPEDHTPPAPAPAPAPAPPAPPAVLERSHLRTAPPPLNACTTMTTPPSQVRTLLHHHLPRPGRAQLRLAECGVLHLLPEPGALSHW